MIPLWTPLSFVFVPVIHVECFWALVAVVGTFDLTRCHGAVAWHGVAARVQGWLCLAESCHLWRLLLPACRHRRRKEPQIDFGTELWGPRMSVHTQGGVGYGNGDLNL